MNDKQIVAAILGGLLGYWWANERHKAACKCNQQATVSDPMAWLGQWQA